MAQNHARFGIDLRLLGDLTQQSSRTRGSDLSVVARPESERVDLETLDGADNLSQALLLRFLTPLGELAALGHPDYGSRLHELIGERNSETNRNRAKLYVLQALAAEPRVYEVRAVTVRAGRADPTRIDIDTPLNLVFPFFLEGGVP
jgi:phage baseplate assembly protein W